MKFTYHCDCKYEITYEVDKACKPPKIIKCSRCGKNVRYTGDDLDGPDAVDNDIEPVIQPEIIKEMKFKIGKKIKKEFVANKKIKTSNVKRKSKRA